MADYCNICDTRRPTGGTNHLVSTDGKLWFEFCPPCGEKKTLTHSVTKETITVRELFDRTQKEKETNLIPVPCAVRKES